MLTTLYVLLKLLNDKISFSSSGVKCVLFPADKSVLVFSSSAMQFELQEFAAIDLLLWSGIPSEDKGPRLGRTKAKGQHSL